MSSAAEALLASASDCCKAVLSVERKWVEWPTHEGRWVCENPDGTLEWATAYGTGNIVIDIGPHCCVGPEGCDGCWFVYTPPQQKDT